MADPPTLEVERTYDLEPRTAVPDLLDVDGVAQVRLLPVEELDATYYDTPALRLAAARITLRRRTGGRDAGWHLKLPVGGDTREELRRPLRGRGVTVPAELRGLVRARAREARLVPVARLQTRRTVHQLLDSDGRVLAEVADDDVTGQVLLDPESTTTWREVEVELVDGATALLEAVGERLQAAGAVPAAGPSKLARVLGSRVPAGSVPPLPRRPTAADAVLQHLHEQVNELLSRDPGSRRDLPDALHKMRVATRRLRSALKTCRPVLDRTATDPIRDELRHLAGILGAARDAEVLRERLRATVADLPPELVLGPVAQRIDDELGAEHRAAHRSVVAELDGARYAALLDALDRLLADPPWRDAAQRPARKQLQRLVRRAWRRLQDAATAADAAPDPEQRAALLHEVRKSAKQVRYATEAATLVLGQEAKSFARRVETVQETLGEHQDSRVARERLHELGVRAHLAGENGFTFGLLHGLESGRAERAQAAYDQLWAALSSKHPSWLR